MDTRKLPLALAISGALAAPAVLAQETIELRDLNGRNGFVIAGVSGSDSAGRSVSNAGDINGDGIDDIIIGAPGADQGGASYVVYGRTSDFEARLDLDRLDGLNGFRILGIDNGDRSGYSASGAGDINGDGIDDVVIGAYSANPPGNSNAGESYVVFGSASGIPENVELVSEIRLSGIDANDFSGASVSSAGDFNNDGIDDLIIGAPGISISPTGVTGESYVVFGSDTGFQSDIALDNLTGGNGFTLQGRFLDDRSGRSVSGAGDVNGDGIDDLIIGSPGLTAFPFPGETYVVFGSESSFPATFSLSTLDGNNGFLINGIDDSDFTGRSVSSAGDINGDGIGDIIIGASGADPQGNSQAGEAYVVFGRDTGFPEFINLSDLDGNNGFVFAGVASNDRLGTSVSGAGDVNGDDIDDIIIGAGGADPSERSGAGQSYVLFGTNDGFLPLVEPGDLNGLNGFILNGIDADDFSGNSVSGAGDVNGDGIDDLLIGAPFSSRTGALQVGESYVVFGNAAPQAIGSTALLFSELEDDTSPSGSRLDFTVATSYLDADDFGGLAIIGDQAAATEGQWQYSLDGTTWQDVSNNLSDISAVVLASESFLRFVPAANFSGQPGALQVRLWDGRWREPGSSVDITNAVGAFGGFANDDNLLDVTVNITPVNDAPSLSAGNPPTVNEDPGGVTVTSWSAFNPGPGEADQFALAYQVANVSNPGLFSFPPFIDTLGNLIYDTRQDVSGSSTFDVRVVDSGGMASGGVNVSGFQTFTITVNPVNDPPNLLAEDPPVSAEDAGPQTVANWASVDAGAADESSQEISISVNAVSNPGLFAVAPTVDASGNLTYTAAPGATGTSTFTVLASDNGGTANGGSDTSAPQIFQITVQGDALFADSFE